jgi:spore germination cell wall hydrolase CwlJ-like protein
MKYKDRLNRLRALRAEHAWFHYQFMNAARGRVALKAYKDRQRVRDEYNALKFWWQKELK